MIRRNRRIYILLAIVVCVGIAITVSSASGTSEHREFNVSIDAPQEVPENQEVNFSVAATIPEVGRRNYEGNLTVDLYSNGTPIDSRTITVEDGETVEFKLNNTFENSGDFEIRAEGNAKVNRRSYNDSISTSLTVIDNTSISGVAFALPESLRNDIREYREKASDRLDSIAFVVAKQEQLYLIFTDREPKEGIASVEGKTVNQSVEIGGWDFQTISAKNIGFNQTGSLTTVGSVVNNPDEYQLDLVHINANHRSVATRTKPPGDRFSYPSSTGILVGEPREPAEMYGGIGEHLEKVMTQAKAERGDGVGDVINDSTEPYLKTKSFNDHFWIDAEVSTDGIVLTPGSKARSFIREYMQRDSRYVDESEPLLYLVQEDYEPTEYDSVSDLKRQAQDEDIVSINAKLNQRTLSVQETVEKLGENCDGENSNENGDGEYIIIGNYCIFLINDIILHGGAAWTEVPQSRDNILLIMGASSREQKDMIQERKGQYQITGEVVSTDRISKSLPEGKVLLTYKLNKTKNIDYSSVSDESREIIENQTERVREEIEREANVTANSSSREIIQVKYTSENSSRVETNNLREAIGHWRSGKTNTDVLRETLDYWRNREKIV